MSVIDASSNTVVTTVPVGANPTGVAVGPPNVTCSTSGIDPVCVYVTNFGDNTVSVIDTDSNLVVATVAVGASPEGVAVSPDGSHVYVANHVDSTVSVIDAVSTTVVATVPVGTNPEGLSVTLDGSQVYVANTGDNTVSVIDAGTNSVTTTVPVGSGPVAFGQFILDP